MARRPKAEERSEAELVAELDEIEDWLRAHQAAERRREKITARIPREWRTLDQDVPVTPRKTRLTIRLDADVAGFFRAMGNGYQARVNAVLRAFMLARRAGEIRGKFDR